MTTENEMKPAAPVEAPDGGRCAVESWFGAVSIVLTLHKENGRMNIWNELSQVRASTRDAAIGYAVREALKRNPGYQVHCLTATEFSPPNIKDEPRARKDGA